MELISGLPDDVARDCLIRVPYHHFAVLASVSDRWNKEIHSPEFRRRRNTAGQTQKIILMVQARVNPNNGFANPVNRLTMLEPETGNWTELPIIPGHSGTGLPMFCQLASVGYDLVVMGGWDPESWKSTNSVFVYNFLNGKWRRGTDMPGGPRTFFACASDSRAFVFIAGGHNDEKNALKSAFAYDVANDEWVPLADMARERDECKAVFHNGKFRVIGGYCTEMQGRFEKSAEAFDVATWQWGPVEEEFLEAATCPRTCVDAGDNNDGDERVFMCGNGGDVMVHQDEDGGATWRSIAKVGDELRNVAYVRTWQGKMLLIGSSGYSEPYVGIVLDLKSGSWRKLETPEMFTGHVQSGCILQI